MKIQCRKKQFVLILLLILVLIFGAYVSYPKIKGYILKSQRSKAAHEVDKIFTPPALSPSPSPTPTPTPAPTPEPTPVPTQKPLESVLIEVPYTVQAPYANWDVHEESCEEAATLMVHYFLEGQIYFNGSTVIPQATANQEMIDMKNWQVSNYGSEPDLTIEALGKFMKDYYGYNYRVSLATVDGIKQELSAGNPVMVPVITHGLQNPYYGRNPSYHILLIKGYKSAGVITNDAGVKEGENYFYTWDILFQAIDQQTPQMGQGRVMIVAWK